VTKKTPLKKTAEIEKYFGRVEEFRGLRTFRRFQ
jgi:hypothetical protein